MGAWGKGIFENDTACDFAANVAEGAGLAFLEQACLDGQISDFLSSPL